MIGWYAHHSGGGHLARATTVAAAMATPVVILSSAPRPTSWPPGRWVALPRDDVDPPYDGHRRAGGALHWAPLGAGGYRERMEVVTKWVARQRPSLVVCDVSVEVTLLVRLLGVPVVVTVMAGDRSDAPHRSAYDVASALVAPWPRAVGSSIVHGWESRWDDKTSYVGALSRFDGLPRGDHRVHHPGTAPLPPGSPRRSVVVLWGAGGSRQDDDHVRAAVRAAAEASPTWTWSMATGLSADALWHRLRSADVVVTHAGQNALAEVATAQRPAVVIAQDRPHGEQLALVRGLTHLGLRTGLSGWPEPNRWPALLESALATGISPWVRWSDGGGAHRYAARLEALAREGVPV